MLGIQNEDVLFESWLHDTIEEGITTGWGIPGGFSKWAANLPLGAELFEYAIAAWPREQKKLNRDWP